MFGTGPAGLSAAFAARDLQLSVQVFGRNERYRKTIETAVLFIMYCQKVMQMLLFVRILITKQL